MAAWEPAWRESSAGESWAAAAWELAEPYWAFPVVAEVVAPSFEAVLMDSEKTWLTPKSKIELFCLYQQCCYG